MSSNDKYPKLIYEIELQGELDESWKAYFDGVAITITYIDESPITTLVATVVDQPALRGLLCKLWDLNLTLISVRLLEPYLDRGEKK